MSLHDLQGLLFHVAADSERDNLGIAGPVFTDDENRFEYLPSGNPRDHPPGGWGGCDPRTYRNIPAHNSRYGETLADFTPSDFGDTHPHIDPEFTGYSYGEPDEDTGRVNTLRKLKPEDILFFVASLSPFNRLVYQGNRSGISRYQNRNKNKFVIGFFKIRGIAWVQLRKESITITRTLGRVNESHLLQNHHYTRMCSGESYHAIIWKGHPYPLSARMEHAVQLTQEYLEHNYLLTSLAQRVLDGRERDTFRGGRWVNELSVLLDEILARNPELTRDHSQLKDELLLRHR